MKNLIALGIQVIQTSAIRFFIHTSKKQKKKKSDIQSLQLIFLLGFFTNLN